MEILRNGSNANDKHKTVEEQVTLVVHGFVQVWNKFEETIAREIAEQGSLKQSAHESRFGVNNDLLFRVGTTLGNASSLTMGELSSALSVPLSTATRVVDTLVERGYVERFSDTEDRRVVHVKFTARGNQLYKFIDSRIAEHVRELASSLSKDEMATLVKLLGKVAFAVKQTLK